VTDFFIELMQDGGYLILALIVLVENLFPPIPSEAILPLAGFFVFTGEMTFFGAMIAATTGSVVGALMLYAIGRYGGRPLIERHRRYLRLTESQLDRADAWFDRHGPKLVFFGRMVPGVRSIISVPAGMAEMRLVPFTLLTLAGSALWNALLIGGGWAAGREYERVADAVDTVGYWPLLAFALMGVAAVLHVRRRRRSRSAQIAGK
jgi:membrane protein DedA with SNARE-associated domain